MAVRITASAVVVYCLATLAIAAAIAPAFSQESAAPLSSAPAATDSDSRTAIPSWEELEAQGATIGDIVIVNGDVFATDTPEEDKWLFRLANKLHARTKAEVIRQQLLFKAGEPYRQRLLLETERILRNNRYIFDTEIAPVAYRNGVVDIEVRTRDVWTFKPGINFSRSGGSNTSGFEVQESNLFGYGKEVTVARRKNVDRVSTEYRYFDPRILGTWNRFSGSYSSNSDGRRRAIFLERLFYSLDTRWAGTANALDWVRTDQRYNLGAAVDEFRHLQENVELGGGWSDGLRDGWVRRIGFGVRYQRDLFAPTTSPLSAAVLPEDRKLAYPYVGYTVFNDEFEERRNQDQIERTEDLYSGTSFQASLGVAQTTWGADRNSWLWTVGGGSGFESTDRTHTLVLSGAASGRVEHSEMRNVQVNAAARYYWRVAERQLLFASLHGAAVEKLDADKQLMLGGDSGLRGYPLRYQDGSAQALLTIEHRWFTKLYIFRLFHVGAAVFFDAGRSWGRGNAPVSSGEDTNQGLLKDVGFGLRFGSSRSAFGNVIHVDLAFPLDGEASIDNVQFLVTTKKSF